MKNLSASKKTDLQTNLSNQMYTLSALQTKIDADTDIPTLKTDVKSITKNYRIYLLILPQARIAASADRINTIVGQMQTLAGKLETRITAANATALQSTHSDLESKLDDATAKANAAVTTTAGLAPDNGSATLVASNSEAVKAARAQIESATKDLVAARADIETIIQGLKSSATATSTVTSE